MTIQEVEERIEAVLSRMRNTVMSDKEFSSALDFLAPRGFRPVVELQEDGRKKRRTASADNWQPWNGEIRIYFERAENEAETPAQQVSPSSANPASVAPARDARVGQLLQALEEAENTGGRSFVALKWFRDEFLSAKGYSWTQTYEDRQDVLASAIRDGLVLTSKVPNPRAPLHPTTTLRVNRQRAQSAFSPPASRFRPVHIAGEPLSSTLLRDRGPR